MSDPLLQFPQVPDGVPLGDVMLDYPDYRCVINQMSVGVTSSGLVAFAFEAGAMSTANKEGLPRYHAMQFLLPAEAAGQFGYLMMEQARAILEAAEAEADQVVEGEIVEGEVDEVGDAARPVCSECQEVAHDADCVRVGDGRPVEGEEPVVHYDEPGPEMKFGPGDADGDE